MTASPADERRARPQLMEVALDLFEQHDFPRLCLGTHCPRGSASLKRPAEGERVLC